MKEINGTAAIVTGGASGLGAATARMLAEAGAKVAIFDMNEAGGMAQAEEIGGTFFKVDVTNEESVRLAVAEAEVENGIARVLVNCAGIATGAKTVGKGNTPHPLEQFRKTIEINLIGTFTVIAHFAARLSTADPIGEERGVIVNTASVAAFEGQIGQAAYSASKGGVYAMTLPVARDLAQEGVRVNTILPGIMWTPMMAGMDQKIQDALAAAIPFPSRLGTPADYASLALHLAENVYINGECIRLDGAIRLAPR